jgi:hypothetical protein
VVEGLDTFLSNRLITADGTQLVTGDVSGTISVRVYDLSAAGEGRDRDRSIFTKTDIALASGGPLTGADHLVNTLETGTYWDGRDTIGMNFCYRLIWNAAGSTGPYLRGGHKYRVDFEVTTTAFGVMRWTHILDVSHSSPV